MILYYQLFIFIHDSIKGLSYANLGSYWFSSFAASSQFLIFKINGRY